MASNHIRMFVDQGILIVIINVKSYVYTKCYYKLDIILSRITISIQCTSVIWISVYINTTLKYKKNGSKSLPTFFFLVE